MRIAREKFIADIAGYVKKYAGMYGILVYSSVIAQAVLESGWGESRLASQYHNYFGLKCGTRWTGRSVNMRTQEEYREGTLTFIRDNFRVFDSMEEGVKGYFEFIQLERYRNLQAKVNELVKGSNKKSVEAVAKEVLAGKWGNGEDRKKRLQAAGYDYRAVQRKVNELMR